MGIETSCDETAASVVDSGKRILSNVVSSQVDIHKDYGGIVPELASRHHLENMRPVIECSLKDAGVSLKEIDAVAVTIGPGLVGALLVGLSTAKSICYAMGKPLIGVNHLEGHVFSIFLEKEPPFPFVGLVVSGGHTDLYLVRDFLKVETLGRTRDDAAGECFDKTARILGLPYPGGPIINQLAKKGDPKKFSFPRPMMSSSSLDFSFSGLKTFLKTWKAALPVHGEEIDEPFLCDVAASFQEAVVDVLVSKTLLASERNNVKAVVASGGVACNTRLRERFMEEGAKKGIEIFIPSAGLCTDNAAMIAATGYFKHNGGKPFVLDVEEIFSLDASANLEV